MSYTNSTDFLHLPQYSKMDVLNVLSDFNKAMYNIDVGVSTIHMIVNNVLLSGNLTQEELEKVKKQIADLSRKAELLETSLATLKTTVETNEKNTTTALVNFHSELVESNNALEKTIDESRQHLQAEINILKTDIENLEKSVNQNLDSFNTFRTQQETVNTSVNRSLAEHDRRITNCENVIPFFHRFDNPTFTLNTSGDTVSNLTVLHEETVHDNYNKEDITITFNYATTNETIQNLELSFKKINPLNDLLSNSRFTANAMATAIGYNENGYELDIACGVDVRFGKLILLFPNNSPDYRPTQNDNFIIIHLSGFAIKN